MPSLQKALSWMRSGVFYFLDIIPIHGMRIPVKEKNSYEIYPKCQIQDRKSPSSLTLHDIAI